MVKPADASTTTPDALCRTGSIGNPLFAPVPLARRGWTIAARLALVFAVAAQVAAPELLGEERTTKHLKDARN